MKINYHNMPAGRSKFNFLLRYIMNIIRTWYLFHFKYPWVKYNGFVRIMPHTSFAKMDISIGNNVQFGNYCNVASNVKFGNYILIAGRVCFIGRNDHIFTSPGEYIWYGERGKDGLTIVEDDVWIGHNYTIIAVITIGQGSQIASGSIVKKNDPPCEIWGGVPAKKIRDRFSNISEKEYHLQFLNRNSY